jgi:hypothetical protein
MDLIKIDNDSSDHGRGAVLASPHPKHAVVIDRHWLCGWTANRIREVKKDAVRVLGRIDHGGHGSAEFNFYANVRSVPGNGHVLHCRHSCTVLRRCAREQEQHGTEMFLGELHFLLTLVGVPVAAGIGGNAH